MLNDAFGIGFIQLNAENPEGSTIHFQSRIRQDLDWNTINRIAEENDYFKMFLKNIFEDIQVKVVKSKYDPVLEGEEAIEKHIKEKNIKAQHNNDE
jgi:hypothetical protein